jgi:hypothetical protein
MAIPTHDDPPPPAAPDEPGHITCPPAEPPPPSLNNQPSGSIIARLSFHHNGNKAATSIIGSPFEATSHAEAQSSFNEEPNMPSISDSVIQITDRPRVFGLRSDSRSSARIRRWLQSLMDGGANICVTGDLNRLVNIIDIPPMLITVATSGDGNSLNDCCTKRGYIPLTLEDGTIYWQPCFYCANITETVISPQAILATSDVFALWCQTGYKDGRPGCIRFDSHDGILSMTLSLEYKDGLYYCPTDVYTVDDCPLPPQKSSAFRVAAPTPSTSRRSSRFIPTSKGKLVESELWLLCLGSPGVHQLDKLPGNVTGTPPDFDYHPFWFIDFKEAAQVQRRWLNNQPYALPNANVGFTWTLTSFVCPLPITRGPRLSPTAPFFLTTAIHLT